MNEFHSEDSCIITFIIGNDTKRCSLGVFLIIMKLQFCHTVYKWLGLLYLRYRVNLPFPKTEEVPVQG